MELNSEIEFRMIFDFAYASGKIGAEKDYEIADSLAKIYKEYISGMEAIINKTTRTIRRMPDGTIIRYDSNN